MYMYIYIYIYIERDMYNYISTYIIFTYDMIITISSRRVLGRVWARGLRGGRGRPLTITIIMTITPGPPTKSFPTKSP